MSTQYNGVPANVNFVGATGITSSTAANPSVVVATAHGMTTGDRARIVAHQTNTAINGTWDVTVIDANTFSVPILGIGGGGGATGDVIPLSNGATAPTPSDGDNEAAASVDVMLQALADRTARHVAAVGQYKLLYQTLGFGGSATGFYSLATWAKGTDTTGLTAIGMTNNSGGALVLPFLSSNVGVQVGDVVLCQLDTTAEALVAGCYMELWSVTDVPGGPGTAAKVVGSTKLLSALASPTPVTLRGWSTIATNGYWEPLLFMAGQAPNAQLLLQGDWTMTLQLWRPTGYPQ